MCNFYREDTFRGVFIGFMFQLILYEYIWCGWIKCAGTSLVMCEASMLEYTYILEELLKFFLSEV